MGKRVTLDDLQMAESFEYEVKHPVTGKPVGISSHFQQVFRAIQQAQRREALSAAKQAATDREAGIEISDEEKAAQSRRNGAQNCRRLYRWMAYQQGQNGRIQRRRARVQRRERAGAGDSPGMRWLINQLDIAIGRDGIL